MIRARSLTVLTLAAFLTLVGCSAAIPDEPSSAPSSSNSASAETEADAGTSATPATGDLVTGDGYSYRVPEGWAVPDEPVPGFSPDSIALDYTDTDGFADNVNVILSPAGAVSADLVESAGVAELEGAGATDVKVQPRIRVSGAESAHLSAALSTEGSAYLIEQYYATDAGQTYVITFSFSDSVSPADREALAESVLASWSWA